MKEVSFIFATGESRLDWLVTTVTGSRWSHVAFRFDAEDLLVEALAFRGLLLQPGNKYETWPKSRTFRREVAEEFYSEMLSLSRRWSQQKLSYGYFTCVAIGLKEVVGFGAGRAALSLFPGKEGATLVCSEMIVKLWRIAYPDFLQGRDPRLVSPDELYQSMLACEN